MLNVINPETVMVDILNFDQVNNQLTLKIRKYTEEKFYLQEQYYGLIVFENRAILVSRELDLIYPQIKNIFNPEITYNMSVLKEYDGLKQTATDLNIDVALTEILKLKTGTKVSLKKFMENNFNSSFDINKKMFELFNYLHNQETYTLK